MALSIIELSSLWGVWGATYRVADGIGGSFEWWISLS